MRPAPDLRLYLVTDEPQCASAGRSVLQTVVAAVDGGVTCVQLRAKDTDGGPFLAQVLEVSRAVGDRVPVIVNDRVDVFLAARELGAAVAGVHIGQSDLPAPLVRALIGDDAFLGLSASTDSEIIAAQAEGACDHLGIGAVHDTATKTDAPGGLGVAGVARAASLVGLPAVAIGGVKVPDMAPLAAAGLDGGAVVSAICCAPDPRRAAAELLAAWTDGLR
ncbi:thiamine-phosphate diphosphorylase [Propionibacterium ruminifibrarum]|uniref:Thiamine-phosphate synthase n=1 Tax=Propionibacterium ruminifibrarum TaxID=1962131 RepID=A0A375I3Q4_9ACTN|nr:thiamine phosphate synthase [Propionibacterium ruminifibrarum]SPF68027.1 thiamine-phosphate diphosphorylase [Propionibacterium ruminifibrarum]